jgi:3-hydroxybutyryl-CoA dehydrogenase
MNTEIKPETDRPAIIAVIGAGTMGSQIAYTMAVSGGHAVRIFDTSRQSIQQMYKLFEESPGADGPKALKEHLIVTGSVEEAVKGSELVIEAVPEQLDLKRRLLAQMSSLTADAVLATNSSSFKSRELADVTEKPERLLNAHFYPEPWKRVAVELMSCGQTSPSVIQRISGILRRAKLQPIVLERESTGFVFNRVWHAIKSECLRVVAEGVARPEDIDKIWCINWGTAAGPFRWMDAVGLDVVLEIERTYAKESGDPRDNPPRLLEEMVERGELGRKTSKGFYRY